MNLLHSLKRPSRIQFIGNNRKCICFGNRIQTNYQDSTQNLHCTIPFSVRYITNNKISSRKTPPSSEPFKQIQTETVLECLQKLIQKGDLVHDPSQLKAAKRLTKLQKMLHDHDEHCVLAENQDQEQKLKKEDKDVQNASDKTIIDSNSAQSVNKQTNVEASPQKRIPRGLFLHGEVGTGKSLLMDTFFHTAPMQKKRRVHFHSFLQEIHARIHQMKKNDLAQFGRNFHVDTEQSNNPIFRVAMELSNEVKLICFDEFQVTDVADALILSQLFLVLWANGTVMVATSNRPPEDLYEGGLNRGYFLPFIDLLKKYCLVMNMNSSIDYRRLLVHELDNYFFVNDVNDHEDAGDEIFQHVLEKYEEQNKKRITSYTEDNFIIDGEKKKRRVEIGFNRTMDIKQGFAVKDIICRFKFDELCRRELGSSDYRAIASQFRIIMLQDIPLLTLREHDQARRFITLVDELYEGRCCVACIAIANPDNLFVDNINIQAKNSINSSNTNHDENIETNVGEMFGIDVAQSNGKTIGELASVKELSFAFKRASSRLVEMTSKAWWNKHLSNV